MKLPLFMIPLIAACLFVILGPPFLSDWLTFLDRYASFRSSLSSSSSEMNSHSNATAALPVPVTVDGQTVEQQQQQQQQQQQPLFNHSVSNHSVLASSSSSSPPPPPIDEMQILPPNRTRVNEEFLETAINEVTKNASAGSNYEPAAKARKQRRYTKLERIEAELRGARAAIREAMFQNQTQDSDFVPSGPMYWNAKTFHRSYQEMEKELKIFVYEEGEPPLFHNGPCKNIYSTEGNFIHAIEMDSRFRTNDPNKAHVFFLPLSVVMLVRFVYVRDSHDFTPLRRTVADYVNVIGTKYPFWNRTLGADHFMLSCHDWGPEVSKSEPHLYKNSIRVLCNANTSEGFNPSKDVSLPEINLQTGVLTGFLGGPSPSRRPILAFFAGGLHGPIRPILIQQWENKDQDIRVHQYLPEGVSYIEMMRKSRFCLCPSGYEVASPRIVEAIYTGCVPVLISDHYVPPFSDVLNWKSFSVEVSVNDIPNLKKILAGISTRQYLRMYRRVVNVRRHFVVNFPPKRFDVYHMILHSVWLRRLNLGLRDH
ncbi:probable glycosyltransferase At5g03795 [Cucurbita pepo subsp. pepo]|uniref:probable glycosyltransferase At5g03795 n=1 Tax=Cucurbita pepo subsp. pepo TaxID=3664 RepID=UPI000C9D48A1|nr:probable glycosyltransferase At5g03795 [Cucurbita pepo subsp. pepo]